MNLKGSIQEIESLDKITIDSMYHLMDSCYDDVYFDTFKSDLSQKHHSILLRDESKNLQGFSTLAVYPLVCRGETCNVLFSGDTIINPDFWGSSELPKMWLAYSFSLMEQSSDPCYWFLMSKGYKTYRFLPTFFNSYIPMLEGPSLEDEIGIRDTFAKTHFSEFYDANNGVIRFGGRKDKLKEGIADIDDRRMRNPQIAYFVSLNPGWQRGDELACVARLDKDNLTSRALGWGSSTLKELSYKISIRQ